MSRCCGGNRKGSSRTGIGARITRSTNQSFADGVAAAVAFSNALFDTSSFLVGTSITIPAGESGLYTVSGDVTWEATSNPTNFGLVIAKNGTPIAAVEQTQVTSPGETAQSVTTIDHLVAGDVITLVASQTNGIAAALNVLSQANDSPILALAKIGT